MDAILVVDDDPAIRMLTSRVLEDEGYPVATAEHGAAALEIVTQQPIGLVLLDMQMPVLDGPAFVAQLQAQGVHLPIVVISGAAAAAQQWAQRIAAVAYLPKPFHLPDLLAIVERYAQA